MGHAKVATKLGFYAHLSEDGHAEAMAALGAMHGAARSCATSQSDLSGRRESTRVASWEAVYATSS